MFDNTKILDTGWKPGWSAKSLIRSFNLINVTPEEFQNIKAQAFRELQEDYGQPAVVYPEQYDVPNWDVSLVVEL